MSFRALCVSVIEDVFERGRGFGWGGENIRPKPRGNSVCLNQVVGVI